MGTTLFESPSFANHEGVHAFYDEKTGLKAIVAVHSTARGPAVGGTRMWNYASSAEALEDVLRLSKGMSYKKARKPRATPARSPPRACSGPAWSSRAACSTRTT